MEPVFQLTLLFLPALIMLTSTVFHALAAQDSINLVLEPVPLAPLEPHGTDKHVPQLPALLAQLDTFTTLPQVSVSPQLHHAGTILFGTVLVAFVFQDST